MLQLARSIILLTKFPWRLATIWAPDFECLFEMCILSGIQITGNPVKYGGLVFFEQWMRRKAFTYSWFVREHSKWTAALSLGFWPLILRNLAAIGKVLFLLSKAWYQGELDILWVYNRYPTTVRRSSWTNFLYTPCPLSLVHSRKLVFQSAYSVLVPIYT